MFKKSSRIGRTQAKLLVLLSSFYSLPTFAEESGANSAIEAIKSHSEVVTKPIGYLIQPKEETEHQWDRYVRKFRRDHHLAASMSYDKGNWYVGSFGRIKGSRHLSQGIDTTLQYSFHIQLLSKFGYYLGSSTGYFAEFQKRHDEDFGPSSMWKLPGIAGGFVFNYNSTGRILVGSEIYLSRIVRLETKDSFGESQRIAISGESFDLMAGWDRFVTLNWAVRVQYYDRKMWVPSPRESTRHPPIDANIHRTSRGGTIGGVYHFL